MTKLLKRAVDLEETETIEIIYDDGMSDMGCRFVPSFLRESLYQSLLYREQKRKIHTLAAHCLINNSFEYIDKRPDNEYHRLITHLLQSENADGVTKLSLKSKRIIAIKKTMSLIKRDVEVLKSGMLLKQTMVLKSPTKQYFVL